MRGRSSSTANRDFETRIAKVAAAAKRRGVVLPDGASAETISKAEATLGVALPAEFVAFYRTHDGGGKDGICNGFALLPIARIVEEWKGLKSALDNGVFNDHHDVEPNPDVGVRAEWWIKDWIPITSDGCGNCHVLDLAPEKEGSVGQVVVIWHDYEGREREGDGFLDWLETAKWGETDADDSSESPRARHFSGIVDLRWRFWIIQLDGASVTIRFGEEATLGQETTNCFPSVEDATRNCESLIAEKIREGYQEK